MIPSSGTRRVLGVIFAAGLVAAHSGGNAQQPPPDHSIPASVFAGLRYRQIGPPGNRVSAVVGVAGDRNVFYVGAASGGVWKSIDGGTHWQPIFDDQPAQSIGTIAVAPSQPNTIWVGTGETWIRSNISIGNGIYKSTDGGATWHHMGLDKTGRIGRIVIDPRDADVVFAAALGHCYGPQQERGVYRSHDGGKTWERVLFVDENTGAADIAMDPWRPDVLFVGMWQVDIKTWGRNSGGPGSGVYVSRDGGNTWSRLARGLPEPPLGKIAVAVAPSNSSRVYALIETGQRGALWRSDNGGVAWRLVNPSRLLNERPHYYTRMAVSPVDENEIYFLSNSVSVSYDGGETAEQLRWGGDDHDMWIDPTDADRMMIGDDGHALISTTHGRAWTQVLLPIAQMYHVAVDNQIPYFVYGNKQDGQSYRGPSNSLLGNRISSSEWINVAGCEWGFAVPDPVDNNIVWGSCFNGGLDVFDLRTHHMRSVRVWPRSARGAAAKEAKYRFNWTFPIAISPHDHNVVYVGSQHVHKTTDGGQSWTEISADLSTNDPGKLGDSGGLTVDNLGVEYGEVVFAIAESAVQKGLIWAGTNDGQVQVTRDGGARWTNVTSNIPDLPAWGTVSNIEPSRFNAGTAYITVDIHQMNNRDPYVYKTSDFGKTWKSISSNLPRDVFGYVHCVREDPVNKGLLYLGTENGLYVSFDDGARWVSLQLNLPHAPVHWLTIQEHFSDLVVATYGRGFWILDGITPLRALSSEVLAENVHLFTPRPTYRFERRREIQSIPNDQSAGENPPEGASIDYYLKAAQPNGVSLQIAAADGRVIRTLRGTGRAGINRVWWDLRHEAPPRPKLRTRPPGNPTVWDEKRFRSYAPLGWRPLVVRVINGGLDAPQAIPGTYTVRIKVGDKEMSQSLVVKKDPHSAGTEDDVRMQVRTVLDIQRDFATVVHEIDRLEWLRKQVQDMREMVADTPRLAQVGKAAATFDDRLAQVEALFLQPILAEGDDKSFRAVPKLFTNFAELAGDVMSADFRPTNQQLQVHKELKQELAAAEGELKQALERDLAAFNRILSEHGLSGINSIAPDTGTKVTLR
jgi:photosystem II stability/assembly factor-like uncharacterized protein